MELIILFEGGLTLKKKITLSICLLVMIFGGLYYFTIYSTVHEIKIHADYVTYNTEDQLSNDADIILYGTPKDKFEDREHVNKFQNGTLLDFYTLTDFNVQEVIKNSTTLTINKSDSFKVIEPAGMIQEIDGKKILEMDAYKPMNQDNNYVIFLKNNGIGGYSIINMSNGAFNMDETKSSISSEGIDNEKHSEIKKSVKKKYSKFIH